MLQLLAILLCILITNQVRQIWQSSGKDFGAQRIPDLIGLGRCGGWCWTGSFRDKLKSKTCLLLRQEKLQYFQLVTFLAL